MTLTQLRIFAAVVRHGGIRPAARLLGMAQSGVVLHLRKLEEAAGVGLLHRSNRGVSLTAAGATLLARVDVISAELARAEQEMRHARGEFVGTIALGLSIEAVIAAFPRVLADFRSRYPHVSVHLMSGTSRAMIEWVRDGKLDFACALMPPPASGGGLTATPLFASLPVVVCRKGHALQDATSLAALVDAEWVGTRPPDLTTPPNNRLTALFALAELPSPTLVVTTESLFDSLHLVAHADYLAYEPAVVVDHPFFAGFITRIAIEEGSTNGDIALIRRAGVALTPVAHDLASMISSYSRLTHPLPALSAANVTNLY